MYAIYMVTFTINIPQMLAYIPYMDPMGHGFIMITLWPLVIVYITMEKSQFLMGKSTISMAIFNSYGISRYNWIHEPLANWDES